jgi:hypothetical protein
MGLEMEDTKRFLESIAQKTRKISVIVDPGLSWFILFLGPGIFLGF